MNETGEAGWTMLLFFVAFLGFMRIYGIQLAVLITGLILTFRKKNSARAKTAGKVLIIIATIAIIIVYTYFYVNRVN